jgi:hypothetical protein
MRNSDSSHPRMTPGAKAKALKMKCLRRMFDACLGHVALCSRYLPAHFQKYKHYFLTYFLSNID